MHAQEAIRAVNDFDGIRMVAIFVALDNCIVESAYEGSP